MDTERISRSEAPNVVVTTVANFLVDELAERLADRAKKVEDGFQEVRVKGREYNGITIGVYAEYVDLENDLDGTKNESILVDLRTRLGFEATRKSTYYQRVRSIGTFANELSAIQHACPCGDEALYEVSRAFAEGHDEERVFILDAVKNGTLNPTCSQNNIREIKRGMELGTINRQRKESRGPSMAVLRAYADGVRGSRRPFKVPTMTTTDDLPQTGEMVGAEIAEQRPAEGVTSTSFGETVAEDGVGRNGEVASAHIVAAPPNSLEIAKTERQAKRSLAATVEIIDLLETETTVSGRFVIHKSEGEWNVWAISDAIKEALHRSQP